jgi:hypothetical protein
MGRPDLDLAPGGSELRGSYLKIANLFLTVEGMQPNLASGSILRSPHNSCFLSI